MKFKEFYNNHIPNKTLIGVYFLIPDEKGEFNAELRQFVWKNPNGKFPFTESLDSSVCIGNWEVEYSSWTNQTKNIWGPLDDINTIGDGYTIPIMNVFLKWA